MLMITRSQTPQAMRIAQAAQVFFLLFFRCFRSFHTRRQMLSIVGSAASLSLQSGRARGLYINRPEIAKYIIEPIAIGIP